MLKKRKNHQNMCSGNAQTTPLLGVWHGTEKASQKIENSDKKVVCYHDKNPMQKQNDRVFKMIFVTHFLVEPNFDERRSRH